MFKILIGKPLISILCLLNILYNFSLILICCISYFVYNFYVVDFVFDLKRELKNHELIL